MKFAFLYTLKRSWRTRSRFVLMAFFLSLGFWGWLLSESSQSSIRRYLAASAKQILSADVTVSVRREFSDEEQKHIEQETQGLGQLSKGYELFAMMSSGEDSRLVLVRVIEDAYPFYGKLNLESSSNVNSLKDKKVWAYSEFKTLSNLKLGDQVTLGDTQFQISDFVDEDQTQTFRLASLAPRVFIHMDLLKATNLIQFGSTFTATYFFKANEGADVNLITQKLKDRLKDPAIDVTSYLSLPDDQSSPTQRLTDFLGLTSLVALLFSALSLFYLLQMWSLEQQKERALLSSFGVSKTTLYWSDIFQAVFVSLLSTAFSTVTMILTSPLVEKFLKSWTGQEFLLSLGYEELGLILTCQFILLLILSNPFSNSKEAPLSQLIKNNFVVNQAGLFKFLPLFLVLWPFAILASRSLRNGTYFFVGLIFISISLVLVGRGVLRILAQAYYKSWRVSLALKSLQRQSTASWAFIFTVGVSSALLNLIPQIQSSIEGMMQVDQLHNRPSLFLFDIQSEQWPDVQAMFEKHGLKPTAHSPLVRGRITSINEVPFERQENNSTFRTREDEEQVRFRNRGVNVTYRPQLQNGETIVSGEEFPMTYNSTQQHVYLSLEKRYAGRIGADIGDTITFDIQGIEVKGVVKNLREVSWSRFEPNFFILFQDGVLNDAPQTHLTSLPYMPTDKKIAVMKDVAATFSNVSIIDVERLMKDVISKLKNISGALKLMTYLTLLTGLMTLVFLLTAESRRRSFEIHLLKVLGAEANSVLKSRVSEVMIVSILSLLIGIGSSYIISYVIVDKVFQVPVVLDVVPGLAIMVCVVGLSWIVSVITTRKVFKQNSFAFLKKEE